MVWKLVGNMKGLGGVFLVVTRDFMCPSTAVVRGIKLPVMLQSSVLFSRQSKRRGIF